MEKNEINKDQRKELQLVSDEAVLNLIRSNQWSQRRRRRISRSVGIAVVALLLPLLGYGVWRLATPVPIAGGSSENIVAQNAMQPQSPVKESPTEEQIPVVRPSHISQTKMKARKSEVLLAESSASSEDEVRDVASDELFAEIRSSAYSTIMWNDHSDADTIVNRLNSLFGNNRSMEDEKI